jgi:hypothetical protein
MFIPLKMVLIGIDPYLIIKHGDSTSEMAISTQKVQKKPTKLGYISALNIGISHQNMGGMNMANLRYPGHSFD